MQVRVGWLLLLILLGPQEGGAKGPIGAPVMYRADRQGTL